MGYYLIEGSYSGASIKAIVSSPSDRGTQAKSLVESVGGTFHHFFFTLGDGDFLILFEAADDTVAAAISMGAGSSGAFAKIKTTKLLTPAEGRSAMAKAQSAKYTAPGSPQR